MTNCIENLRHGGDAGSTWCRC